ncbi:MAG: DNA polymerase III subunit alpha [Candidatus Kapaibacterium sp.]
MPEFVHLHNHTHYSLLDAACTPDQLINAAKADGQKALALTDHGVMFGCFEFYKKAKKAGIKPILGCEVYIANGSRFDRGAGKAATKKRNYFHLVLLAKNDIGYKNLMKLTTLGHTEGFYYRPRIDTDLLEKHHEGLIALSACLAGVINAPLLAGDYETARNNAIWYKNLFGDDFYIELQDHGLDGDEIVLAQAPRLAEELGIKLIVSNDCHYIKKEHAVAHNVLLHIKDSGIKGVNNIHELRYGKPEMYFKSSEEMSKIFKDFPQAFENTLEVAEKCDVTLKSDIKMPTFPIPQESKATTLEEYLEELTYAGLERRYPVQTAEILDRVKFELGVIKRMGYAGYFLIVQDFIIQAQKKGVRVGPGRGSAAGSVVAYALGIINVDPIKYDLLFERFLNPDRVSMPDIDIDFSDDKRDVVIDYVKEKYGEKSVAQIITFGTLSSRAVLKDVGRVLGVPLSTINSITEKIPVFQGKVTKIKDAMELPDLRWLKETDDPKLKELIEYASTLEGMARNSSLHAAGVVIAPGDINEFVPLYKSGDSGLATQYTMKDLEDAGLLKMDFLGLRTLSIIDNTLDQIKRNHGLTIDLDTIDLEDKLTYDMLGKGKTQAVFQFESGKMQESLMKLKPTDLEDLIAMNALYRPGPMENIPDFIDRKHGRKQIEYIHPVMEKCLKKTYGIIVYQEQVMQLVQDIAGFTLAQADSIRRAMGKKDAAEMLKLKIQFIEGAEGKDIPKKIAEEIFELLIKFASYGFNKSHSCAYAYLAFQTAWLKAHYTAEFLAANMTAEINDLDKVVALIDEAKAFEINTLPPDVNKSVATFMAIDSKNIVFGLAGIKGVGISAVESIIKAREEKPFTSFYDFAARCDNKVINRRVLEALISSGAFDSLKIGHRAQLFAAIDSALEFAKKSGAAQSDTNSMFGGGVAELDIVEPKLPTIPNWSETERLEKEKEVLNFYLSGHPLMKYRPHLASFSTLILNKKDSPLIGKPVRCCGLITAVRTRLDKKEQTIAFVMIEDFYGKAECIFWSDAYKKWGQYLHEDTVVMVRGKSELNADSLKIIVEEVIPIEETVPKFAKGFNISINAATVTREDIERIKPLCVAKADSKIVFSVMEEGSRRSQFYAPAKLPLTQESTNALTQIFGPNNVRFVLE